MSWKGTTAARVTLSVERLSSGMFELMRPSPLWRATYDFRAGITRTIALLNRHRIPLGDAHDPTRVVQRP